MSKSTKRPQAQKPKFANPAMMVAMQGKRSSNAAGPHRLKTTYVRKGKYGKEWE